MTFGFTPPIRLVDYFFAINVSEARREETPYQVLSYYSYPTLPETGSDADALRNITPFCFPSPTPTSNGNNEPIYHDFVLTDERGLQRYGCCLRSKYISAGNDSDVAGQVDYDPAFTTSCICLISNQPWYNALRAALSETYSLMTTLTTLLAAEHFVWKLMHEAIIPPTGNICMLLTMSSSALAPQFKLQSPKSCRDLPRMDFSLLCLFETLGVPAIVDIFALLLLEKSVLVHSDCLTILTRCQEALLSLLYPMTWDMVYVPIVPRVLKDLIEAPTQFLMGGESNWVKPAALQMSHDQQVMDAQRNIKRSSADYSDDNNPECGMYLRADLDTGERSCSNEDMMNLAHKLPYRDEMIKEIRTLLRPNMGNFNRDYEHVVDIEQFERIPLCSSQKQTALRSVFLKWSLKTFKGFYALYSDDGHFDERLWFNGHSDDHKEFYAHFIRTSMFSNFTESRSPDNAPHRIQDVFDMLVLGKLDLDKIGSSGQSHARAGTFGGDKAIETFITIPVDLSMMACSMSPTSSEPSFHFDTDVFDLLQVENGDERFHPVLELLATQGERHPHSIELLWMQAYIQEKCSKLPNARPEIAFKAMKFYGDCLRRKLEAEGNHTSNGVTEFLHMKLKKCALKVPVSQVEEWLQQDMPAELADTLKQSIIPPPPVIVDTVTAKLTHPPKFHRRALSTDTSDRLILNCDPVLQSHAHVDSNESIDENISETMLSPSLRSLVSKPVDLAIQMADMLVSMYMVLSEPPAGTRFSTGTRGKTTGKSFSDFSEPSALGGAKYGAGGSIRELRSFHPVMEFIMSAGKGDADSKKSKFGDPAIKDDRINTQCFVMEDPVALKAVKKMPTYEAFKNVIVALRFVKLDDMSEEHLMCFWLNVRNALHMHLLVEFGAPINYQHRMTFLYHKPVYCISGHLFSLNEITHGILRGQLSFPAIARTGMPKPPSVGSSNQSPPSLSIGAASNGVVAGIDVSKVHVHVTSSTTPTKEFTQPLFGSVLPADDSSVESLGTTKKPLAALLNTHAVKKLSEDLLDDLILPSIIDVAGKVPIRFLATDPRTKFRFNNTYPLVNFCLVDGTKSGPRMTVFRPHTVWKQIAYESEYFLSKRIEYGKHVTTDSVVPISGSISSYFKSNASRKRLFVLPQLVSWYLADFVGSEGTVETFLIYMYLRFPNSALAKFLHDEEIIVDTIKKNKITRQTTDSADKVQKQPQPQGIESNAKLQLKMAFTQLDWSKVSVRVKDHCWDFKFMIPGDLLVDKL